MKAFQFKLDTVLTLRTRTLEAAQQDYAQQQQRVLAIEGLLNENQGQLQSFMTTSFEHGHQVDPVSEGHRFAYIQFLKTQREGLQQQLVQEKSRLLTLRQRLQEAHLDKKSLDTLKDKQQERYNNDLKLKELMDTDDLLVQRFGRH
jgi:flagellar export protein FliJ